MSILIFVFYVLSVTSHASCIAASLAMSTSFLEALPGKLDIKNHLPSVLYISAGLAM